MTRIQNSTGSFFKAAKILFLSTYAAPPILFFPSLLSRNFFAYYIERTEKIMKKKMSPKLFYLNIHYILSLIFFFLSLLIKFFQFPSNKIPFKVCVNPHFFLISSTFCFSYCLNKSFTKHKF